MLPDRPQGQRMKGSGMLGSWCRVETWAAGRAEHREVPGRGGCKEFLKDFEPDSQIISLENSPGET